MELLELMCHGAAMKDRYWPYLDAHVKTWYLKEHFQYIALDANNRMLRIGFGKNEGRWFIRADLWFAGFRWTK